MLSFLKPDMRLETDFRKRLQGVTVVAPARKPNRGTTAVLHSDSLLRCLLLALHAGDRAPGRATELSDNPFLLVFRAGP